MLLKVFETLQKSHREILKILEIIKVQIEDDLISNSSKSSYRGQNRRNNAAGDSKGTEPRPNSRINQDRDRASSQKQNRQNSSQNREYEQDDRKADQNFSPSNNSRGRSARGKQRGKNSRQPERAAEQSQKKPDQSPSSAKSREKPPKNSNKSSPVKAAGDWGDMMNEEDIKLGLKYRKSLLRIFPKNTFAYILEISYFVLLTVAFLIQYTVGR